MAEPPSFHETINEELVLEKFGYEQELKRNFSLWGMVGFSFSIVTSWSVLGGVLISGIKAGGPPVMIWGWIAVCLCSLTVAYAMAEICSSYPVAGGQYSWVMALAPPKVARGMSWVTGWFLIIGLLAGCATIDWLFASFLLAQVNLVNPSYVIQRWHIVLVSYVCALISLLANIFCVRFYSRLTKVFLGWNILTFFVVVITILATNKNKNKPSFVFKDFNNATGFPPAMTAILGLLQAAFGMCCYDAPAHMTEEMKQASREAPKAIVTSVYLGGVTGFIFLVSVCFCIGDIDHVANTPTGVPLLQIFYDSTGSTVGACFLLSMMLIIGQAGGVALVGGSSRTIFAFARDHGLPFSSFFAKVDRKRNIPIPALVLATAVQFAFLAIYFGTVTGFLTIVAICTEGFYISYAMPMFSRLLSEAIGNPVILNGPYKFRKSVSLALNILALFYLLFTSITFNFPYFAPVTKDNMNYNSAAVGLIMLISLITWITTGRKRFTGPKIVIEGTDESASPGHGSISAVVEKPKEG